MKAEMKPRAKTAEEAREELLRQIRGIAKYWAEVEGEHTIQDRCDGLAFSILNIFDGGTIPLPAIDLRLEATSA